ncbi:MAG: AMP-binding protein [Ilumatobacter sp.]|nr:AMP-binding protein [Ilumatobacter sp.]
MHDVKVSATTFGPMIPGVHLAEHGDKPAIIMANSGFTQTYRELDAAANRLSRLLRSAGLNPGDHIAICMENHDRYLEIIWGCHYAGLVYTAASSRLQSAELEYVINDCGARAYITSKYKSDQAAEVLPTTPNVELRLMLDGSIDGYEAYESAVEAQSPEPLDETRIAGMDMLYSSGTTGMPKGITRAFPNEPLEEWNNGVTGLCQLLFGVNDTAIYLSPAPFYHAAPLRFCMAQHALGATIVAMENFDAERYLQLVDQYGITHSQVVPTMFVRMLKLDSDTRAKYDVSSLEYVIHAAAPCPVPTKKLMIEWFGPVIHEYYAGSEGNGFVYCNSEMWLAHEGTVGSPIGCTLHICGEEGEEVPQGQPGTVFFDGGAEFEYHNDPAKTKDSRHPKGWSTLGDVGYLDSDGFLYLTDRKAYMIISGGVNIYPQEAENVLVTHDKVIDVAVFGVPNDDFGEEVKAVVQPRVMPTTADEAASLAGELIQFCKSQIADVKCPRSVDFREELPRHPTGKLYKRLLKDEYARAAGRDAFGNTIT